MSKLGVSAWILTAVCLLAAVVAVVGHPLHWKRTVAAALVVGVIATVVAVLQSRRGSQA